MEEKNLNFLYNHQHWKSFFHKELKRNGNNSKKTSPTRKIHWIDWNLTCNLKDNGGLGIVDIGIKNRALLNKWIWRYGKEPNVMWRVIIASKYGGNF